MNILKKIWNENKQFEVYMLWCYVVNYCLNIADNNHNLDMLIILKVKPLKKLIN